MYDFIAVLCTLAFLFIALLLIHNLTVFIHELGHAIPKLIFTKSKVSVYLGSYGENEKSIRINLGILELYILKHFFWSKGMCIGSKVLKHNWQNIIIVFCGPIASILIAILSIIFIKHFQLINFYMIIAIFFLMSSVFDLLHNLIPDKQAIVLENGNITYNDGQLIRMMLFHDKTTDLIEKGNKLYKNQKYNEALFIYKKIISLGYENLEINRLIMYLYVETKDYKSAVLQFDKISKEKSLNSNDYMYLGFIKHKLNDTDNSIKAYDKALDIDSNNILALNNKAYLYMELNNLEEAMVLLEKVLVIDSNFTYALNNKAYVLILNKKYLESILVLNKLIEIDKHFAYAYNNRAYSYIKTGKLVEAFRDLNESLFLDNSNADLYKNFGIYYIATKNKNKAFTNLKKAKELNPNISDLDNLLDEAKQLLPHSF